MHLLCARLCGKGFAHVLSFERGLGHQPCSMEGSTACDLRAVGSQVALKPGSGSSPDSCSPPETCSSSPPHPPPRELAGKMKRAAGGAEELSPAIISWPGARGLLRDLLEEEVHCLRGSKGGGRKGLGWPDLQEEGKGRHDFFFFFLAFCLFLGLLPPHFGGPRLGV